MTKIICLTGGPGVGKSTVAAGVYSKLKQRQISCELVQEVAKEITWEGTQKLLENQIHVFSEQFRRQFRLINKVSYVITDSPLILNSIYFDYYLDRLTEEDKFFTKKYEDLSRAFFDATFQQFNNLVYVLQRSKSYDINGRNQTLKESIDIDNRIFEKLVTNKIEFINLYGNEEQNIDQILHDIGV